MSATANQIRFRCPECHRLVGIDARMAGREVLCPGCQKPITVPAVSDPQGPPKRRRYQYATAEAGGNSGDGEFRLIRRRGEIEEMDLTPMVDVTFLLLIFFMITASFSLQKTLETPPPDPKTQGASPIPLEQIEENSVIVRVEPNDVYFVDDRPLDNPDDLALALNEAMSDGNRAELVIEADDAARHESVVRVYDAGNEVGMQRIRLANPVSAMD